jgi:hypothetical protein
MTRDPFDNRSTDERNDFWDTYAEYPALYRPQPFCYQSPPRPKSPPPPRLVTRRDAWTWLVLASLGIALALVLLWPACARADSTPQLGGCIDTANTWCVQPATAVGWQLNLKTFDVKNAAVLVGYSLVHRVGFAVGVGLYGGVGLSADAPNAPQGHLLVSLANFGAIGIGVQRATFASGSTAWQAVFGLYGNLNFGGTPTYVMEAAK